MQEVIQKRAPAGSALAVLILVSVLLLGLLYTMSTERLMRNRLIMLNQQLDAVFADVDRDNDPANDVILVQDPRMGTTSAMPVYRARQGQRVSAVAITLIAPDGYSGDIRLLLGIDDHGKVLGARVLDHRETPGLGDRIEYRRSPWITTLNHRSLTDPTPTRWHTRRPDGAFDAITGATITSEAILSSVRDALEWYDDNRAAILVERDERASARD